MSRNLNPVGGFDNQPDPTCLVKKMNETSGLSPFSVSKKPQLTRNALQVTNNQKVVTDVSDLDEAV